jgi:hypothetical protein
MSQIRPKTPVPKYSEFLENLKVEIGDFLNDAEYGKSIRHSSLRARKKSIAIRELLKLYRQVALENDRRIEKIMSEARKQIKNIEK